MSHFLVPYFDESFRPMTCLWDLSDVWGDGRRQRSAWNELVRDMEMLRQELDSSSGAVCKKRKDAFEVALNVNGFQPKDINVSVKDNMLTVSGSHEEKSSDGCSYSSRQFSRSFRIPDNVKVEEFKSRLLKDGRTLRIEAPLVPAVEEKKEEPKDTPIAINYVK